MTKRKHPTTWAEKVAAAQRRIPIGATITNRHGTAVWNGRAWVYGRNI